MRSSDILSICARNLVRRKLRTFLTALGVVIGVALIIIAISIGIGLQASYEEQLSQWGDLTVINVYNWGGQMWSSSGSYTEVREKNLNDEVLAQIQAMDGVDIVTPFYEVWDPSFQMRTKDGRYEAYGNIYGIYPEALEKLGYTIKEGESLREGDREYSVVVGENFAYNFRDTKRSRNNRREPYPDQNGVIPDPFVNIMRDKLILFAPPNQYDDQGKPKGKDFEVVPHVAGVLERSDRNWEATNSIFIDIRELQNMVKAYNKQNGIKVKETKVNYQDVRVKCVDVDAVEAVQSQIKAMGYDCYSMNDSREMMKEQALMIQLVLGGLAGFSLLVAAIGIANTMIMSIYERTREIGVMKVIGAELKNIRLMFLLESGMIGLLGGVLGVGLSVGGSWLFNNLAGGMMGMPGSKISIIPPWLVLLALFFSLVVGVVFGFLPANRAVKISALEAIKHD